MTSVPLTQEEDLKSQVRVRFISRQQKYAVTDTPILVPSRLRRYGLSEIVNHLLAKQTPVPFDFLVDGSFLRGSIQAYLDQNGISAENLITIEFLESMLPPSPVSSFQHDDWVSAVQGHLNFGLFLTGSYDKVVRVWNSMGECAAVARGHTGVIKDVAWINSSENEGSLKFLSASQDQSVLAWKVNADGSDVTQDSATILYEATGHTGSVESLSVSSTGDHFATASTDSTLRVWSTALTEDDDEESTRITNTNKRRKTKDEERRKKSALTILTGHVGPVSSVAYNSSNPNHLYSGGWDHSVRVWDVEGRANIMTKNCEKAVHAIDYSPAANLIVSGHSDHILRLWDPRTEDASVIKLSLSAHKNWVSSVSWCPNNAHTFASGSYDGSLKVWDIRSKTPLYNVYEPAAEERDENMEKKVLTVDWTREYILSGGESSELNIHKASA